MEGKPEEDRYRDPETSPGEPDWSCRTEQRERPKRDCLMARDVWNGNIVNLLTKISITGKFFNYF